MKIDHDCPHCKKGITLDMDELKVLEMAKPADNATVQTNTNQVMEKPKEPEIKTEIKTVTPKDEPFFACANGNCGDKVHRNENYSKKPNKKCKNCDSLNGNKICKNCGNIDEEEFTELEDEDLKELGIPMPGIDEHEEHNHE